MVTLFAFEVVIDYGADHAGNVTDSGTWERADDGTIIRTNVSGISVLGRATQGVRIMRPNAGAHVISAALTEPEEDGETDLSTEGQDNVENSAENVEE